MALFNEILVGRFNRAAQKLFSMKGPPVVPTLSTDVGITLRIPNDQDLLWLFDQALYGNYVKSVSNAAGVFGCRLTNAVGSNVVAVVRRLVISTNIADTVILETDTLPSTSTYITQGTGSPLDGRNKRQNSSIVMSATNGATTGVSLGGGPIDNIVTTANQRYELVPNLDCGLPLLPGQMINLFGATNAAVGTLTAWWTERFLEDSERT